MCICTSYITETYLTNVTKTMTTTISSFVKKEKKNVYTIYLIICKFEF